MPRSPESFLPAQVIETEKMSYQFFEQQGFDEETARHVIEQIEIIVANPDSYIDRGGAATVHRMGDGLCVKMMEPRHNSPNAHLMKLGNTVPMEAGFQRKLMRENVNGVRVPWVFGFAISKEPNGMNAIFMEELSAVNLQHVLNRTAELPKTFDQEQFIEDVESFVAHMHSETNIFHGDLEPRNIMIDIETGKPRIIDFGRAVDLAKIKVLTVRQKKEDEDYVNVEKARLGLNELLKGLTD